MESKSSFRKLVYSTILRSCGTGGKITVQVLRAHDTDLSSFSKRTAQLVTVFVDYAFSYC